MELEEIQKYVKSVLSEKRYYHSVCVMEMCEELAIIYGVDVETAKKVGIAHDVAKEISTEDKFKYMIDNKLPIDEIEEKYPTLLHAKIGQDISIKNFGFTEEMGQAILAHTTAKENMTMLTKILYISDWVGKDREFEDTYYLRELAKKDIDKAILYSLDSIIKDKIDTKEQLHVDSILARNYLLKNN